MSLDDRQLKFIGYLLNLAKEGREDRGALADLRSGLGKEPGQMARVHKHVVPYLPEQRYNDRWYYVTATLFGSFPQHKEEWRDLPNGKRMRIRTLGKAFRPLREKSDSMKARFVALLNAHPEDLDDHLRHGVSLLKANEQPLDWFRLLDDLLQWDDPDGRVQLNWARDFYKSNNSSGNDTSQSSTTAEEKEIESHE
jgi:CRISPR system Cascade subunit CasB